MKSFRSAALIGGVVALTGMAAIIGLVLLIDRGPAPNTDTLRDTRLAMTVCALVALCIGLQLRQIPAAQMCAYVSALILLGSLCVFVWGGYHAQITHSSEGHIRD